MPTAAGIFYSEVNAQITATPPVILIHGAGSDHLCWPAPLRRLKGRRTIALDLPGHGRSGGTAQQSVSGTAAQLFEFLVEINVFQAILVGHSLGGAIALQAACDHPERIAALGIIAGGAYLALPADLVEQITHLSTQPVGVQLLAQRLFSPGTPPDTAQKTLAGMTSVRPGVLAGDWRAAADFDVRGCLGSIQAPVWAASGAEDRLVPPSCARFLTANLANSRLQIIPRSGHMVIHEAPAELAQGLQLFLDQITAI